MPRITHISDISDASRRQCDGKEYKKIGWLKLNYEDLTCIKCLTKELDNRLKDGQKEGILELIKKLTYDKEFDILLK